MIDALQVKREGRDPVLAGHRGPWRIEVYRVGRLHEYQAIAARAGRDPIQTARIGGPGAMQRAYQAAEQLAAEAEECS